MPSLFCLLLCLSAGTAVCFEAGRRLPLARWTPGARALAWTLAFVLSLPALAMAGHYLHLFDGQAWFCRWRAEGWSPWSAAGAGLPAGMVAARGRAQLRVALTVLLALVVWAPYVKPVLMPLDGSALRERWRSGVCLQSTPSTCGPASAATLLAAAGYPASEADLARACFTSQTGTEAWYLVSALRARGQRVEIVAGDAKAHIPAPAIAGVRRVASGHFIAILGRTAGGAIITADPVFGRAVHADAAALRRKFDLTGFYLKVVPAE